ncbi:ABC transporter substrate-binding protein [Acidisoma cellulosilytica]|uniref:ABC transporter substrate-binding protein n=1 Tax=Acidisoma cellulosilyticum TaxID=2802395 RepID=A0A963Z1X4_9PROT|nr:ABC transporter substrate-binding protein [Acidisoma cellulosilyticum]MCB8881347.1 ABC transporter substrate-binding protein [Acidisoma cellulosilyticum]
MRDKLLAVATLMLPLCFSAPVLAQSALNTLVVAGPRTPESLDQEYPPTEASHEARRNIYERLLAYDMKAGADGVSYENFDKIVGRLAESYDLSPDETSITFHLRHGVKSAQGDPFTADDVMWTFQRGWALNATFHWYMTQVLGITDFDKAFQKIDDYTVKVSLPHPSPLLARLWVNNDLGILDEVEMKKHLTPADPWGSSWLATHSASFAPYSVTTFLPGQTVIYQANPNYYLGAPRLSRIVFREIPDSSNRTAAVEAGAVDVAEWLEPRELNLLQNVPGVHVYKMFGNYIERVEMNNDTPPFNDPRVRQALNYLVPRSDMLKSVFFGTARETKSPISEIYPGYTDAYFQYTDDLAKAKALLAAAGYPNGFRTTLGYRTDDELEQEQAVILKTAFARAGVDVQLDELPSSSLVEKYSKGQMPMYFFQDMAIVPDPAYVANLWLNSASLIDYSHFKNAEVDKLIDQALTSTDQAARLTQMKRVQEIVMDQAPWVFLFNPGYQLATRTDVHGVSWYTPNGNTWYDFHKSAAQ